MCTDPPPSDPPGWADELDEVAHRIGRHFTRSEPRARAVAYICGLLSAEGRRSGRRLALQAGGPNPYGMQHLLGRSRWDPDRVRDELLAYVREKLDDPGGVLVLEELHFPKRGNQSAGVHDREDSTFGPILNPNRQVGLFLVFAGTPGCTAVDRELYLPRSWDRERLRTSAGIPSDVRFTPRRALAARMIQRARNAGFESAWLTAGRRYGADARFRKQLEDLDQHYVLEVDGFENLPAGRHGSRVRDVARRMEPEDWNPVDAVGADADPPGTTWATRSFGTVDDRGRGRWVLAGRGSDPAGLGWREGLYLCRGPAGTPTSALARVARSRRAGDAALRKARAGCGLDQYEVRSWIGWHRHVTLSLLAAAILVVTGSQAGGASR